MFYCFSQRRVTPQPFFCKSANPDRVWCLHGQAGIRIIVIQRARTVFGYLLRYFPVKAKPTRYQARTAVSESSNNELHCEYQHAGERLPPMRALLSNS